MESPQSVKCPHDEKFSGAMAIGETWRWFCGCADANLKESKDVRYCVLCREHVTKDGRKLGLGPGEYAAA